jgi:cell shape-determining protein MreD
MTRVRLAAGLAALLTCLALQAGVIAPLVMSVPISLPALLVAAVALCDGPGAGIGFGFAAGLIADLGSTHPAGIFALTWMGIGMVCGLAASKTSLRTDILIAGAVCAVGAAAATGLLTIVGADGATAGLAIRDLAPALFGDVVVAIVLVPLVRRVLRADVLRAPREPAVLLGLDS